MAVTRQQVAKLYVANFNRAPDAAGLDYWTGTGTGEITTLTDLNAIAKAMQAGSEASTGVASMANDEYVISLYSSMFGRTVDATDAGVAYWVNDIILGNVTRANMIQTLIAGALGDDATVLNNKTEVGLYYADTLGLDDEDFSLATVTDDAATVTAAKSDADALVPISGETFTLTTGVDTLTGTANDDVFTAVNSSLLSEGTLQTTDKIDGAAGADTINISMKQAFTGFTTGSMTNVETVKLTNDSTAAMSFDATGVTGVTKYVLTNNVSNVNNTLSDVASLADVEVSGTAGTSTLAVAYTATSTVATGTQTDVQNLKVTNVGTIDTDATSATNAKYMTVDIDKVETLAITTAGTSNSLDLSASADTKTITVAGSGQTEINAVSSAVTSFDASAATGNVIVNSLAAAASNTLTTVKTGSGDDIVKVVADDLTANATISGGTGADTLAFLAGTGKTLQATVTGFETINVGNVSTALTFSGTNATDIATINIEGLATAAASFVNMKATALTMNSIGAITQDVAADNAAAVTYNLNATAAAVAAEANSSDATFSGATALTVNVGQFVAAAGTIAANAATSLTVNNASKVVNSDELNEMSTAITAGSATTVTVDSDGRLNAAALNLAKATSLTLNTGSTAAEADSVTIDAPKLTTLNVTAAQNLAITEATALGDAKGLGNIQNLTVTTDKAFSFAGNYLDDAATVTVGGTKTTSAASLGNLGAAALTHNISVTATGLKAGLTTGTITTDTGAVTLNVSGVTGNVEIGNVVADAGITVTATNLVGTLDATSASTYTTTTGNISIDVSNATSATQFGTLTTSGGTTGGSVTVNAASAMSTTTVGVITGKNVTVDGTSALGAVVIGDGTGSAATDILANSTVTYKGTNMTANGVDIEADATSTALVVALTGGAQNETIAITGGVAQNSITVSGNLGAGTNSVTVTLVDNNTADATSTTGQTVNLSGLTGSSNTTTTTTTVLGAEVDSAITYTGSAMNDTITFVAAGNVTSAKAISISDSTTTDSDNFSIDAATNQVVFSNLSLSGIEKLTIGATGYTGAADSITINASAISGKTIDLVGSADNDDLVLTGTSGNDVIDLSSITTSDATKDVDIAIAAGAGNDTIVLSAAGVSIETLKFVDSNGRDTISSFTVNEDKLDFGTITGITAGNKADQGTTSTAVATAADATTYVFASSADNGPGTGGVITDFTNMTSVAAYLEGALGATSAHNYIAVINDASTAGKAYVYLIDVNADDVVTNQIDSGDLTLIGVITADAVIDSGEIV